MNARLFRTPEVAQLYEEVREWCHPEYPFLDPSYSLSAHAPAVDFTTTLAEWIRMGKEEAIFELWSFLSPEGNASAYTLRKWLGTCLPSWLRLSETAKSELKAIYLLTMRAKLILPQDISGVSSWLAATTIACRQIEIEPSCFDELLQMTQSEVNENSLLGSVHGRVDGARLAVDKALSALGPAESAAEKLKVIPPMARAVVSDYFQRGWGCGKLRFDLYYDNRMYGCGGKWNQHYVDWLGFFAPPTESAAVPAAVTKDLLREALELRSIHCKRTTTRKAMIEQARGVPGLLPALILRVYPEQQELRPEWAESLMEWATRVRYVESVGAAMIKLLGLSVIKGS